MIQATTTASPGTAIFVQRAERDADSTTLDYSLPDKTIALPGAKLELLVQRDE